MPKFSVKSNEKLNACHERLQRVFNKVIEKYNCTILVGHRTKDKQEEAFDSNASKKHWPDSKHNSVPSMAVDVSPYPIPKAWGEGNRDEYEKFRYFAFYVLGVANTLRIKIRWGGDWDMDHDVTDQTFNDLVHFEYIDE